MDPNLVFQAHHRFQKENLSISLGPRTIIFSNQRPYIGWTEWNKFIIETLSELIQSKVFRAIERCGLRYINTFNKELFEFSNISVNLIGQNLKSESTSVRTELVDDDIIKILHISNNVAIISGEQSYNGSIVDIDCISNFNLSNEEFSIEFNQILENFHKKEKELFFNILKDDFIEQLEPIFED
jgi:uncharacterized protein (TIGR04255 family)